MTREEIIRMAREAGFEADESANDVWITDGYWAKELERFAALVAAHEREACAKVCEARYMGDNNREDQEARRCAAEIRARNGHNFEEQS